MSSSIKDRRNDLLESLENGKLQLNRSSRSSTTTLFETFIPEHITINDGLMYNRQHNLYFHEQISQQDSIASGSNSPLSIFIAHTYDDSRRLQNIEQILETIRYQEKNINLEFGEIALDTRWKMSRHDYLESVDLILLLVTRAFVATEYCYSEQLRWAILRHREEKAYIIPILLQACLWDGTPFSGLHTITPANRRAVDEWPQSGRAINAIAKDIRAAVRCLRKGK
jgi:hypothetical protein